MQALVGLQGGEQDASNLWNAYFVTSPRFKQVWLNEVDNLLKYDCPETAEFVNVFISKFFAQDILVTEHGKLLLVDQE